MLQSVFDYPYIVVGVDLSGDRVVAHWENGFVDSTRHGICLALHFRTRKEALDFIQEERGCEDHPRRMRPVKLWKEIERIWKEEIE